MSRAEEADDPGHALERTALAWTRSALSLAAIGALILRAATDSHLPLLGYPVGSALVIGALLLWLYGSRPYRTRAALRVDRELLPATGVLRVIAGTTVAVAVFALVFALVIVID